MIVAIVSVPRRRQQPQVMPPPPTGKLANAPDRRLRHHCQVEPLAGVRSRAVQTIQKRRAHRARLLHLRTVHEVIERQRVDAFPKQIRKLYGNYRRGIRQVGRPLLERIILRQLSAQRQLAPQLRHLLYLLAKIPRSAVTRALARKSYRRMPVHETSLSLSTLSGTAPSGQGRPSSPDPTPPR